MISSVKRLMRKDVSIIYIPCILSIVCSYYVVTALSITYPRPRYKIRIILVSILISLAWILIQLILNKLNITLPRIKNSPIIIVFFVGILLAVFITSKAWGSGLLCLNPYEEFDNGMTHIDTLFHSTIAENYKSSLRSILLINNEPRFRYHTLSHMLVGYCSKILGMPCIIFYNYLYPCLLCPTYVFSQLIAVSCCKNYFQNTFDLSVLDLVVVFLYNVGVVSNNLLDQYFILKEYYIVSESFILANTVAFISFAFFFYLIKKEDKFDFYLKYVIPFFVFFITWGKVSVGFLFYTFISYYVFRTVKGKKKWGLTCCYSVSFLTSLYLFNGLLTGQYSNNIGTIHFMDFTYNCTGPLKGAGHYIILLIMPTLFIVCQLLKNHYTLTDLWAGRTIWIEAIVIVSVFAFLPGMVLLIPSGSACYFSYEVEVLSLILLSGQGIIDNSHLYISDRIFRRIVSMILISYSIFIGIHNTSSNPLDRISNVHSSNLFENLYDIKKQIADRRHDYSIYADDDTFVSEFLKMQIADRGHDYSIYVDDDTFVSEFYDDYRVIFALSSITGTAVINATYYSIRPPANEKYYFTFRGSPASSSYGLSSTTHDHTINLSEAINIARNNNKKHIIHIEKNGFKIIDIN